MLLKLLKKNMPPNQNILKSKVPGNLIASLNVLLCNIGQKILFLHEISEKRCHSNTQLHKKENHTETQKQVKKKLKRASERVKHMPVAKTSFK